MDDEEILQAFKEAAADDLRFYSNLGKPERERWVVSELLRQLSIPFAESELVSPDQESKVDVLFRSANFQVKEIVDPGLQRGRVAKEAFNGLKEAKTLEEIRLPPVVVRDVTPPAQAYDLVLHKAKKLSEERRYKRAKEQIDLLFYVTRTRTALIQPHQPNAQHWREIGWRSVCCLIGKQAKVLHSTKSAPQFIRDLDESE